jgi:hypothetical protein
MHGVERREVLPQVTSVFIFKGAIVARPEQPVLPKWHRIIPSALKRKNAVRDRNWSPTVQPHSCSVHGMEEKCSLLLLPLRHTFFSPVGLDAIMSVQLDVILRVINLCCVKKGGSLQLCLGTHHHEFRFTRLCL